MERSRGAQSRAWWLLASLCALLVLVLAALPLARGGFAPATHASLAHPVGVASTVGAAELGAGAQRDAGSEAVLDASASRVELAAEAPAPALSAAAGEPAPRAFGVRVVDSQGRERADVDVVLLRAGNGRERVLEHGRWSTARGMYELRDVPRRMREPSPGRLEVGVLLPRTDAPRARVWPELVEVACADALELALGEESSAQVLVVERGGGRIDVSGKLRVAPHRAADPPPAAYEVAVRGSSVRLAGLEPERELELELRVAGRATARARVRPGEPGTCAECVVEIGPLGPSLAFEVRDPTGTPVGKRALRATLAALPAPADTSRALGAALSVAAAGSAGARARTARLRGDADGRVEWNLAPLDADVARELVIECDLPGGSARATALLPRLAAGAPIELAPLVLAYEPLVATGWVRDERGVPIRGARVRIEARPDPARAAVVVETRTRRDGRFELRGALPRCEVVLRVSASRHLPVRVNRGVPPLLEQELVLQRAGALEGRVEVPREFPPEVLALELSSAAHGVRRFGVAPDGSFAQRGLPAGSWKLDVLVGREWPCAQLDGLEIAVAGICRDERLMPLDLSHAVAVVGVELVDPDGEHVPSVRARVHDRPAVDGQPARARELRASEGWLAIPTSYASVDAEFHAPAHASRRERALGDGARVELGSAPRARIELGSAVPELAKGRTLWVALAPARPLEGELAQFSRAELERGSLEARVRIGRSGRSGVFALPAAGRYALRVYCGPFRDAQKSRLCLRRDFDIEARAAPQPLRLQVPQSRVASWVGTAAGVR
jgi:hypothetical protein